MLVPVLIRIDAVRHLRRHGQEVAERAGDRLDLQHPLQRECGVRGPGDGLARDDETVPTHDQHAPVAERSGDGGALLRATISSAVSSKYGESLPEEHRVMS